MSSSYKETISHKINCTTNLTRTITVNNKLDLVECQLYDNRNQAESWQDGTGTSSFNPEIEDAYIYTFYCNNVPCHKVDYSNEEECEKLNAFEHEGECIVPANAIMKITYVSTDEDYKETGYYTVELEFIGFKE